ncbi:MAG TPA: tetratricopeptide repeat protein [Kofleriaceae bacterium]|nr:tetratricopeptide repeat protein [Kofleriaceae bacterium]
MMGRLSSITALCAIALCGTNAGARAVGVKTSGGKIPITTSSPEARQQYLEGRDLFEKLRATDAHEHYGKALAADPDFALAHLGMANTAATGVEFFAELGRAVALADKVSKGERLLILGADAGARGNPARQKQLYLELVRLHPADERGHNQLGIYYFGLQDWASASRSFEKAIRIDPSFSQPYNQLGYAYRFLENYGKAEETFKKYIQLLPDDPNPYDSYAELLMKMGRFDESIASYEKALKIDRNFVASYVGIGNDLMFLGRGGDARKSFARLAGVARNDGERRQAMFWTATSYLHEGATNKAMAEVEKMLAVAVKGNDLGAASGDHNLMGNILIEVGQADLAAAQFKAQLETSERSSAPADVKEQVRRNALFNDARVALARGDLPGAKHKAREYAAKVAARKVPFEVWQTHEIAGRIALVEKKYGVAVAELRKANQQDPRVLYHLGLALDAKGDRAGAKQALARAANFNALGGNYAFVRRKAKEMLARS